MGRPGRPVAVDDDLPASLDRPRGPDRRRRGFGAVLFEDALQLATHYLLGSLGGYHPPSPAGEGNAAGSAGFVRAWAIPLVTTGGGLVAGLIVFTFAPEAEGHGTDAAIAAIHHNPRGIRFRAVVVKIVASAITIGSGGSGGREGPTGQISAGFGSLLARLFDLSPGDARIAVSAGVGAGIGSIFGAPLGGAVLAAEIVYREDFEPTALVPAFISSIVGYGCFGAVKGFAPLFGYSSPYRFSSPSQLGWFAVLGIVGGVVALLYAKGFYGIGGLFSRLAVPRALRPAIGGLAVGLIALEIPQVLGTGYGWIQQALGPQLLALPLWIVVALPFARILATGLSIGSGGSGGIFGPGMVIGAFVGAAFWRLLEPVVPGLGGDAAAFVVIGMAACFGSIARAPLAVLLMVTEMTGTLATLAPAMIAVGVATLVVSRNDDTIYRSQLRNREETSSGGLLLGMPLLSSLAVRGALVAPRLVLSSDLPADLARTSMAKEGVPGAPVVDPEGRLVGVVAASDLPAGDDAGETPVGRLADPAAPLVHDGATLATGLEAIADAEASWVPVVDDDRRVLGTLALSDLVRAYRVGLEESVAGLGRLGVTNDTAELRVDADSPLVGRALRGSLPHGLLVVSILRGTASMIPDADTTIEAGDRFRCVGSPGALALAAHHAAPAEPPVGGGEAGRPT